MPNVNELINKAISTTDLATGGIMNADQSNKFIDMVIDESKLLKLIRVYRTNNRAGEFDRINIGKPVTELATEGTDSGNTFKPTYDKIEYSVKKVRSAFDITKETLEDNIEGEGHKDTIMRVFAKRIAMDMEWLALEGDDTLDTSTATNRLLRVADGFLKQIDGTSGAHQVAVSTGTTAKGIDKSVFSALIKALPNKYRLIRNDLRFWVSPTIYQNYMEYLTNRATGLGDAVLIGGQQPSAFGIPIEEIPMLPENIVWNDGTSDHDISKVILSAPKNFIYIIKREFETYWEFKARKDMWENTTYSRVDFKVENDDLVAVANDVAVNVVES